MLSVGFTFVPITSTLAQGKDVDYIEYHKSIIRAEERLFLENKPQIALDSFKKIFDKYKFVFVDDCLEAFQLALLYNEEEYAMQFMEKALENGFELSLLYNLHQGCPCNFYKNHEKRVNIYDDFLNKSRRRLEAYEKKSYPNYIKRINRDLVGQVINRYVQMQFYKDYRYEIGIPLDKQREHFMAINIDNIRFIDSLAKKGIFLGERNLGIYTRKQMKYLNLPFQAIETYCEKLIENGGYPETLFISTINENDYFETSPIYNILYNAPQAYDSLLKYRDDGIRNGYLHPREFAAIRHTGQQTPPHIQLYLVPGHKPQHDINRNKLNQNRAASFLPSYELDSAKHQFGHENHLHLFFGKFNGTR